ncbi:response regulator [Brevundimonas sp. 2R-24]|uniref:Response regulator n=1 Tax=Peiella sedimenti TaxID=3061083 RepID=A0ABT8SJU0_9CAUL|nr:response regulator [Caulobacteraceae bacterium XZ-24]
MRALLVEDEALVAMIAEEALSALGFNARSAGTGAEALKHFEDQRPDLALIDVGLPDMRGDDLARQLRALAPELSVVVASGYDREELRARFADDDRVVVLPKPYTEDDLAAATRSLGFPR